MKPNGRRRWRRRAKKLRHRGDAYKFQTVAKEARRLWRGYAEDVARILPLPPPVFSLRSLVGMSQRRRKYLAWLLWSTTAGAFHFARTHYRVGQRVRPCLVCLWAKCRLPCKDCSTCDGSGVIPARSQVNASQEDR